MENELEKATGTTQLTPLDPTHFPVMYSWREYELDFSTTGRSYVSKKQLKTPLTHNTLGTNLQLTQHTTCEHAHNQN